MKKSERFNLMLTPIEKSVLAQMASREPEFSQSAIVRRLIRREAKKMKIWPTSPKK